MGNPGLVRAVQAKSVSRPAADRRERGDRVAVPYAPTNPNGCLKDEHRPREGHDVGDPVGNEAERRQHEQHVGRDLQNRGPREAHELQQHRHQEGTGTLRRQRGRARRLHRVDPARVHDEGRRSGTSEEDDAHHLVEHETGGIRTGDGIVKEVTDDLGY